MGTMFSKTLPSTNTRAYEEDANHLESKLRASKEVELSIGTDIIYATGGGKELKPKHIGLAEKRRPHQNHSHSYNS